MKLQIVNIQITESKYRQINLEIVPICGIKPTFIKIDNDHYIFNREISFYDHKIEESYLKPISIEDKVSTTFKLSINELTGKRSKSITNSIYYDKDEDFNYNYEYQGQRLQGDLYLESKEFENLINNIKQKVYPNFIHLFVDEKITKKFDHYVKEGTSWDLSSSKGSTPIVGYRFDYSILVTNEAEIYYESNHKWGRLNDFLYSFSKKQQISPLLDSSNKKQLDFIKPNNYSGLISLLLLLILVTLWLK